MSRFKIINLFDKIFVTSAIFLIIFAWINFYIRDLYTTFILSIILIIRLYNSNDNVSYKILWIIIMLLKIQMEKFQG